MQFTNHIFTRALLTSLFLGFSTHTSADIITFEFTGRLTVSGPTGGIISGGGTDSPDPFGFQAPIQSTFTYDTAAGFGSGDLIISPLTYFYFATQFHSITLERVEGSNYVLGNMLVNFGPSDGIPLSLVWDATGLFNAIDFGLQAGDVISGTNLKRNDVTVFDVQSAIPATDGVVQSGYTINQGPAPLATTTLNTSNICTPAFPGSGECLGVAISGIEPFFDDGIAGSPLIDGPFTGMQISLDIGSGNSLKVLSVSAVPVPSAIWLFGSGLIVLFGFIKKKKSVS